MNFPRTAVAVVLVAFCSASCSLISESITSPSESITGTGRAIGGSLEGMSRSISGSFGIDARYPGYARDLRSYVAAFAASGNDSALDFQRGVSRIAETHGIAHWEAEPVTPYAIGQGLREAGVSESELRAWLVEGSPASNLALEGWRSAES